MKVLIAQVVSWPLRKLARALIWAYVEIEDWAGLYDYGIGGTD